MTAENRTCPIPEALGVTQKPVDWTVSDGRHFFITCQNNDI